MQRVGRQCAERVAVRGRPLARELVGIDELLQRVEPVLLPALALQPQRIDIALAVTNAEAVE